MYLQLAENNKRKRVSIASYKRRATVPAHSRAFPQRLNDSAPIENPYVFIPDFEAGTGGIYVREDKFDYMPEDQYKLFMAMLAPYQEPGPMGELSDKAEREKRREARAKKKEGRENRKNEKQKRRSDRSASKNDARAKKSEGGGDGDGGGSGILDKIKSGVSKFINKNNDGAPEGGGAPEETPFYKKPIFIGGAAAAVLAVAYFATKKK